MKYIDPAGKILWHVDKVQALRDGRRLPPVNVEIDLSNRCQLGCVFCHFAYTHTRGPAKGQQDKPDGAIPGGDMMDSGLAMSIVKQLRDFGVKSITWTGGGEPTLHPQFEQIINQAAMLQIDQGCYTNGGLISAEMATTMKQVLKWVYISLDYANAKDYRINKATSQEKFDDAVLGITRLVRAEGNATIGVGFMIHQGNYINADKMIKLARSLGADYCQFRPAVMFDSQAPGDVAEDTEWSLKAARFLAKYAGNEFVQIDLERFYEYYGWKGHGYDTCWWSGIQTVITPNGKVWTCVNKREFPGHELGDLTAAPFEDIWQRHDLAAVEGSCRLLCRGHVANKNLEALMLKPAHANFI